MKKDFWKGRRVLITGHTGFKGAWLCNCLQRVGAEILGIALPPPSVPNAFEATGCASSMTSVMLDIRDRSAMNDPIAAFRPEVAFHLAAQSLVRLSYDDPVGTYATNVLGTVNVLDVLRHIDSVRAIVNITSDKCYENLDWNWGYRENDRLGGFDPYSSSKACAEIVTTAFIRSYFANPTSGKVRAAVATARAGNVIGGGDWAVDRLVPDLVRGAAAGREVLVRNPHAVRPWQHVLEPLAGYLLLGEALFDRGAAFAGAWNFGPLPQDEHAVAWIADRCCSAWGEGARWLKDDRAQPHEARMLKLDISKARAQLHWEPRWSAEYAIDATVRWYKTYYQGGDVRSETQGQIDEYFGGRAA